jgi:hypothetical protein
MVYSGIPCWTSEHQPCHLEEDSVRENIFIGNETGIFIQSRIAITAVKEKKNTAFTRGRGE